MYKSNSEILAALTVSCKVNQDGTKTIVTTIVRDRGSTELIFTGTNAYEDTTLELSVDSVMKQISEKITEYLTVK